MTLAAGAEERSAPPPAAARLALGTAQFGLAYGVSNTAGQVPEAEAGAILGRAAAAGLRLIDTAAAYGNAEERLERLLGGAPGAGFRLVTKTERLAATSPEAVLDRVRRSLEMLGPAPIEAVLVHAASDLDAPGGERLWRGLQSLKAEGLLRRIGFSAYREDEPLALARRFGPDLVQLPFSLLDQRLARDGSLAELRRLGVAVHARSLFLQGLLLMAPDAVPERLSAARPHLAAVHRRLSASGTTPLEAALAYVLREPAVEAAVVGVTRVSELDEILAAADAPPPAELDWASLALDDPVVLNPARWA